MRALILGLIFWALTLLFPSIEISGFWTIAGTIILFALFNLMYQSLGIFFAAFGVGVYLIVSWIASTLIMYLLSNIFNKFIIADGSFLWVMLFTAIYSVIALFLNPSK